MINDQNLYYYYWNWEDWRVAWCTNRHRSQLWIISVFFLFIVDSWCTNEWVVNRMLSIFRSTVLFYTFVCDFSSCYSLVSYSLTCLNFFYAVFFHSFIENHLSHSLKMPFIITFQRVLFTCQRIRLWFCCCCLIIVHESSLFDWNVIVCNINFGFYTYYSGLNIMT